MRLHVASDDDLEVPDLVGEPYEDAVEELEAWAWPSRAWASGRLATRSPAW